MTRKDFHFKFKFDFFILLIYSIRNDKQVHNLCRNQLKFTSSLIQESFLFGIFVNIKNSTHFEVSALHSTIIIHRMIIETNARECYTYTICVKGALKFVIVANLRA